MWKKAVPGAISVAGIGAVALIGAVAPPVAHAAPAASLTINGDMQLAPGLRVLNIDAKGDRPTNGETSGTYTATIMNGSSKTPFKVRGPVTCIHTGDGVASLVYPISGTTPDLVPEMLKNQYAIKVTVRTGTKDRVGVQGPAPTSSFHGCAPGATPYDFDGDITMK